MGTVHLHGLCQICGQIIIYDMASYLVHMIDAHWEIMERVHQTTGDPAMRDLLTVELAAEFGAAR